MAKTVTMDDIAAHAGVSRGAVSLALRNSPKISEKTTAEILAISKKLGYRPNINASRLARANASTIGILISDLHNPVMADILDGYTLGHDDSESDLYLASGFNDQAKEKSAIESFLAHRVRGIVLMGSLLKDADIRALREVVPTVVVGRSISNLDCVFVDDRAGGTLAAEHLLALKHKRFAHIDGGSGAGATLRKRAFVDRIRAAADCHVDVVSGDYTQESGFHGATKLFRSGSPPTAIFAANDLMALGVLGAARDCGLRPGIDFSLVGFDDIALAAYDYVSLTTLSYARSQMGMISRTLIDKRCRQPDEAPEKIVLPPSLVVRKSSLPVNE